MRHSLLIVDDDPLVLETLTQIFCDDYDVVSASSGAEALEILRRDKTIAAIILDIRMAQMDGFETANRIRNIPCDIPIVFNTGYPGQYPEKRIDKRHQPYDYVGKNEGVERLVEAVHKAVEFQVLKSRHPELIRHARDEYGLVGKSRGMLEVYQTIEQVGPSDNKVIILGATGTGKELVAKALHKCSRRSAHRMGVLNCNHKSPDLIESELFGHVRGAFTGAVETRVGLFEQSDQGAVFLDEVGDLDITTQGKLLRVLEYGELQKMGSPDVVQVDVRVICATNGDLLKLVAERKFREDLYYRLKGITITMPTLRDRREDIPDLIDYFAERYCSKKGIGLKVFAPDARELLIDFDWPGNVRHLCDTVRSLIDLTPSYYISRNEVAEYLRCPGQDSPVKNGYTEQVREFKRSLVIKALDRRGRNVSAAARDLGLDPANLRKIIQNLNIGPL